MEDFVHKIMQKVLHIVAEFDVLNPSEQNAPYGSLGNPGDMGLSNPDDILAGTNRGTQNLGSPNIQSDPSNTWIKVNDNTTDRVIIGKTGSGVNDWGMKVSKSGKDVKTAAAGDLIFNSSQDVFKIVTSGTVSIATSGASTIGSAQFPHNLGIIPAVIAFVDLGPGAISETYVPLPAVVQGGFSAGFLAISEYVTVSSIDTVNVSFNYYRSIAGSGTYTIKVYILQETAN